MADGGGRDVFLLLLQVLLEGGASVDGCGAKGLGLPTVGLGLPTVGRRLKQVRAEGGGEPSRTILPMGGSLPS